MRLCPISVRILGQFLKNLCQSSSLGRLISSKILMSEEFSSIYEKFCEMFLEVNGKLEQVSDLLRSMALGESLNLEEKRILFNENPVEVSQSLFKRIYNQVYSCFHSTENDSKILRRGLNDLPITEPKQPTRNVRT